jgi:hypothetical protein
MPRQRPNHPKCADQPAKTNRYGRLAALETYLRDRFLQEAKNVTKPPTTTLSSAAGLVGWGSGRPMRSATKGEG